MKEVSVIACPDYSDENVRSALKSALTEIGGLDFVTPGMKIAIKANLVSYMKPEKAATTHPALLSALTRMLTDMGAEVVIGDSPGGLYNSLYVNRVYAAAGIKDAERYGARLNQDYGVADAHFEGASQLKDFTYTSYLDEADAIINFCKLKSHGMMSLSCAVKNMFGVIPGTMKPEYHYRFPNHADFANMIVDINEYFRDKVKLCICDAVVGMEGNGPTAGDPRHIGAVLASRSPYSLDLVAAKLIGLTKDNVPTIEAAHLRGIAPESSDSINISDGYERFAVSDFKNITTHSSLEFKNFMSGRLGQVFGSIVGALLRSKPKVHKKLCVGCAVCEKICPAKAIVIKNGIAIIDRNDCIRCFCCQEFCPKGAMKVKRTLVARIFVHNKK